MGASAKIEAALAMLEEGLRWWDACSRAGAGQLTQEMVNRSPDIDDVKYELGRLRSALNHAAEDGVEPAAREQFEERYAALYSGFGLNQAKAGGGLVQALAPPLVLTRAAHLLFDRAGGSHQRGPVGCAHAVVRWLAASRGVRIDDSGVARLCETTLGVPLTALQMHNALSSIGIRSELGAAEYSRVRTTLRSGGVVVLVCAVAKLARRPYWLRWLAFRFETYHALLVEGTSEGGLRCCDPSVFRRRRDECQVSELPNLIEAAGASSAIYVTAK